MNKSDLQTKWGKYCNTDDLVDKIAAMYKSNRHAYSVHGICTMLDKYFTQKEPMIRLFQTSNHYIGDMRIAVQKEFEREISSNEIYDFFRGIEDKLHAKNILTTTDGDGKTVADYLTTGTSFYDMQHLPNLEEQNAKQKLLAKFDQHTGVTTDSYKKYEAFLSYMGTFRYLAKSKLDDDLAPVKDEPVLRRGTKTSRAFNTICHHYGVDKFNPIVTQSVDANGNTTERTTYPYDKVFAQYADLVSDIKRKMYFVISLNPLDYLTMSNGVSWKSCHNIYDGCYKGGTLSYMLDKTSIITFVVSSVDNPVHETPKFYRQMIHYDNNLFMQNRLYPQGNDGAVDLYDRFRNFVIEEFSELLDVDGDWEVSKGTTPCLAHTRSTGAHYNDYKYNNSCNMFYPIASKRNVKDYVMAIGHDGICAKCGKPYTNSRRLSHDAHDLECTMI